MKPEDVLKQIEVWNIYNGFISALYAYSNECYIEIHSDRTKVRRELRKNGYKCSILGGIIRKIEKL